MTRIGKGALAAWEFIAGDDWITALGVVVALGLTALADSSAAAWVVLPAAVVVLLAASIRRAAFRRTTN